MFTKYIFIYALFYGIQSDFITICPEDDELILSQVKQINLMMCNSSQLNCNSFIVDQQYSNKLILLHKSQWELVRSISERLNSCRLIVETVQIRKENSNFKVFCDNDDNELSTLIFDLRRIDDSVEKAIFSTDSNCTTVKSHETSVLLKRLTQRCSNIVWINTPVKCDNSSKLFAFNIRKTLYDTSQNKSHIVIGVRPKVPYCMVDKSQKYTGIVMDMFQIISKQLNFSFSIKPVEDNQYGILANGQWNGLVRQLIDKEVDVAVADLTVTYARSGPIDFTAPFSFDTVGIMINKMMVKNSYFQMVSMFSWTLWVVIFSISILSTLMLHLLYKFAILPVHSKFTTVKHCFWFVLQCYTNQTHEHYGRTWSTQSFLVFWWIYVLSMSTIYSGSLISVLTTKQTTLPFKDLDGLADLIQLKQYKVCIHAGSAFHDAVKGGIGKLAILQEFLDHNPMYIANESFCTKTLLHSNDFAYIHQSMGLEAIQKANCQNNTLIVLNDKFLPGYLSFGVQKNSSLKDKISKMMNELIDSGVVQKFTDKYSRSNLSCNIVKPESTIQAASDVLNLTQYVGPLLVLFVGLHVGVLCFFIERYYHPLKRACQNILQSFGLKKIAEKKMVHIVVQPVQNVGNVEYEMENELYNKYR